MYFSKNKISFGYRIRINCNFKTSIFGHFQVNLVISKKILNLGNMAFK